MDGSDSASFHPARRGRRPHGTSRNFMHENRETSGTPVAATAPQDGGRRLRPHGPRARLRGVTPRNSTDESFEQRRIIVGKVPRELVAGMDFASPTAWPDHSCM